MRIMLILLLAVGAARASDFARLSAAANAESDPALRMKLLAQTVAAWTTGDDRPTLGVDCNNLGMLLHQNMRDAEALPYFDKAVNLLPENGLVRSNRALTLMGLRRFPEALSEEKTAFGQEPGNPMVVGNLCTAFLDLDDAKHALPFCERHINLDPNSVIGAQNLVMVYALLGRFDDASKYLEWMRHGDNSQYLNANAAANPALEGVQGFLESLDGRGEQGDALLSKVLAEHPDLIFLYVQRGHARLLRGLYDKAIEDFDQAYARDPKFVDAIDWRAKANQKAGRPAKAAADRAKACRLGWAPDCKKGKSGT
ncbi:MAG: hypothetical protein ACHQ49_17570 [Elusimicrobiota bacterium]